MLSSADDPENYAAASPPPVRLASVVARTQSVGRPTSRRHIIIASHTRRTRRHALPYLRPTISSSQRTGTGARAPGPHRLEFFLYVYNNIINVRTSCNNIVCIYLVPIPNYTTCTCLIPNQSSCDYGVPITIILLLLLSLL